MNKFLGASLAAVAAAPLALVPVASPAQAVVPQATYTTKQVCLPSLGKAMCVQAPASWTASTKTATNPSDPYDPWSYTQATTMGSRWTPRFVRIVASDALYEPFCSVGTATTVVRAKQTAFVDARGKRSYVVTTVTGSAGKWWAETYLTSAKAVAGQVVTCKTIGSWMPLASWLHDSRGNLLFAAYGDNGHQYTSKAQALAAAKGTQHTMAFNVIATVGKGR